MTDSASRDAAHAFLVRTLTRAGAVLCAEGPDKVPTRQSHDTQEEAEQWVVDRGGFGQVWDQYGIWHSAALPMAGTNAGFIVPPSAMLVCIDMDVDPSRPDPRPGFPGRTMNGYEDLAALEQELGPLPSTVVTGSPRGGSHVWYTLPPGTRVSGSGKVRGLLGLDCKGNGGAYVGELREGREVLSGETELAELPSAWVEALPKPGASTAQPHALLVDGRYDPDQAWTDYCSVHAVAGERDAGLQLSLQVKLLGQEAGRRDLKFAAALAVALEHYNPRCSPPFSPREFSTRFRAWYDPGERHAAEAFVEALFGVGYTLSPPREAIAQPRATPLEEGMQATDAGSVPILNARFNSIEVVAGATPTAGSVAIWFGRSPTWAGKLRWNAFAQTITARECDLGSGLLCDVPLTDADVTRLGIVYGQRYGKEPGKETLMSGLRVAAEEHTYHPVREYLEQCKGLVGDVTADQARAAIASVMHRAFGPRSEVEHVFLRKTMIAAVRRAFEPGCKVDTVLLLIGAQGAYKSTALKRLFGRAWFSDSPIDIRDKDAAINLAGVWCTELAELAGMRSADTERVRAFVSSEVDRFRAPYDRIAGSHPRQGILCATSNERHVLNDPEGHRRWWPIDVTQAIDIAVLEAERDRLWALAKLLADAGEPHHQSAVEEEDARAHREAFVEQDPWADQVLAASAGKDSVAVRDLLLACGLTAEGAGAMAASRRMARLLRGLGFTYTKLHGVRKWACPEKVAAQAPAPSLMGNVFQFPGVSKPSETEG